jgi:NAD-dependent dihydropyrimidine dehydrogenase PreA subunit
LDDPKPVDADHHRLSQKPLGGLMDMTFVTAADLRSTLPPVRPSNSKSPDKTNIDQMKCFGCGLCETACPRKAISLIDRMTLPGLKEVW